MDEFDCGNIILPWWAILIIILIGCIPYFYTLWIHRKYPWV
jgi:hypothetical protein